MDSHWVLPLRDGTTVDIPPDKVANINKKIENKEPIKVEDRLILYQDLAGGPRKYTPPEIEPGLVEQAAIAFNEPVINDQGEVQSVWVKQVVSANQWNKYYAQFASYFKLGNHYDSVLVAYRLPIHSLSPDVEKCTPIEMQQLEIKLANS
jgi:hypothetical protein